jgi:predicted nucleic acid-binding protein
LSTQVLQEFFYNATRKLMLPLHVPAARDIVWIYSAWLRTPTTDNTVLRAIGIHANARMFFWDSLILAAAEQAAAGTLYSEDLQHGQTIAGIAVSTHLLPTKCLRSCQS